MASASKNSEDGPNRAKEENEELCTIEASVVTGFEECARGEAREKFGTEVKSSRGKIIWKIPLSRLPEVLKMGSIDNCRVVMHTVPHFKFTDQDDSLARIQKMILDVDWESGLKAWRQLFDFPHPVLSRPDRVPTPEELVDVVVMTRLPQPKDKSEKKKKNQGKGKGKKKDKERKQCESKEVGNSNADSIQSEECGAALDVGTSGSGTPSDNQRDLLEDGKTETSKLVEKFSEKEAQSIRVDDVNSDTVNPDRDDGGAYDDRASVKLDKLKISDELDDSKDPGVKASSQNSCQDPAESEPVLLDEGRVCGDAVGLKSSKPALNTDDGDGGHLDSGELDVARESRSKVATECVVSNLQGSGDGGNTKSSKEEMSDVCEGEEKKSQSVAPPKTVVVKKIKSSDVPKIDIKVLNPAPTENVFPTALESEELRHLEPMEVDSPNASFNLRATPLSSKKEGQGKSEAQVSSPESSADVGVSERSADNFVRNGLSSSSDMSSGPSNAAAAFATSVITRLSSPPTSPSKESHASTTCITPPPTPIANMENPFLAATSSPKELMTDVPALLSEKLSRVASDAGTSVDPASYALEAPIPVPVSSDPQLRSDAALTTTNKLAELESPVLESQSESTENVREDSVQSTKDQVAAKSPKPEPDPTKPKFRVTCNRVGDHPFDSSSAAASFGSAVITYFKWPVDLKKFDIEILLNIDNEEVSVAIALTKTSLHNRNMVAFGPTTLRATICYNMLRLCRIKNGDFICDPMCGTSAIPIESSLNWVNCFSFGGDFHEKAIERTAANITAIQNQQSERKKSHLKLDAVQWNINHFPLRDACVDVFVSDLPFGHRLGSRTVNRTLYPSLLCEMARTARPGARACLLTEDKTSLIKAIQTYGKLWQRRLILSVNIGGLSGFVFVLIRTTAAAVAASQTVLSPAVPSPQASQCVDNSPSENPEVRTEGASENESPAVETK